MTCERCGAIIAEGGKFCPACGHQMAGQPGASAPAEVMGTPAPPPTPQVPVENPSPYTYAETSMPPAETPSVPEEPVGNNVEYAHRPDVEAEPNYSEIFPPQQQPIPAAPTPESPVKAKSKLPLIIGGAVALALIAVIVIFVVPFGGSPSRSGALYYDEMYIPFTRDGNLVFLANDGSTVEFGDFYTGRIRGSMDNSVQIILEEDKRGNGTLWYFTKDGRNKISDDILTYALSNSGQGVAYIVDDGHDIGTLYLYDGKTGESTKITNDASPYLLCISPDGKSVGYMDDDDTGYLYNGGQSEKLGDEMACVAVADQAKHIYYISPNGLYVRTGDNDTKLSSESDWRTSMVFNVDYSEVMFIHNDRMYISRNGADREKVSNSSQFSLVTPAYLQYVTTYNSYSYSPVYSFIYSYPSFTDCVYMDEEYTLWYIGSDYNAVKLGTTDGYYNYELTRSNELYFVDSRDRLNYYDLNKNIEESEILAKDVSLVSASLDGKQLYYLDSDNRMYYYSGSEMLRMAKDVRRMIVSDSGIYYITEDDSLYHSNYGSEPVYLDTVESARVFILDDGICYFSAADEEEYSVYYTDGNTPIVLMNDCTYFY